MRLLIALLLLATPAFANDTGGWPQWRGPNLNNVAAPNQTPVTLWDEKTNILWKAPIAGFGRSSPIIVGDRVLLTTADESKQTQTVLCFDRATGREKWSTLVNRGNLQTKVHKNNSNATSTLAFDGTRLIATFISKDQVQLTSLTIDGKINWQKHVGDYKPRMYQFGYGPTPAIHNNTILVTSEFEDGWMGAFDINNGTQLWRIDRPANTSYSSPVVGKIAGRDQLLLSGDDKLTSFDPATGRELWSAAGIAKATCGTAVWEGDVVFASGGFPKRETLAVKADGSGTVLWRNDQGCYEQSILVHQGHVYAFTDRGFAHCWRATDGKEMWSQRLGGPVSASPVLANGHIYAANEKGTMFVFKADPKAFDLVATNQLGEEGFSTISIVDSRIYLRTASGKGASRQEMLYCIGRK
ncbi:MAG: PQQ-binding-like beta-propeller repeat protein [Phycisphaeraceae bacterium]